MAPRKRNSVTQEVDAILGPAPASYTQPEVVVLRFRRHGKRLVLPVIVLLAIAATAGFFVGGLAEPLWNIAAGLGAALLGLVLGVLPILSWLASRTTVSTRRVIVRRGLLSRARSELALARVREVRSHRGPIQRMFGSGDIILLHGAESLRLEDVPGTKRIVEALQELVERNFAQAERDDRAAQQSAAAQTFGAPQLFAGQQPADGAQPFGGAQSFGGA